MVIMIDGRFRDKRRKKGPVELNIMIPEEIYEKLLEIRTREDLRSYLDQLQYFIELDEEKPHINGVSEDLSRSENKERGNINEKSIQ